MDAATAPPARTLVTVVLTLTEDKSIPEGPTKVDELKAELGVPAESSLWVIEKSGHRKQLGDHETHDVKEDDHYEAIVRGGVS